MIWILHRFFPNASQGLESEDGVVEIEGTTIMFVDFARMLNALDEDRLPIDE